MNRRPNVTVILTCYNSSKYIEASLKSVLGQTYEDLECVIVDDGSKDETHDIVKRYMAYDDRIQYYYKNNGGPSSARNFGVSKSAGRWIQFLDADDWLSEKKLERQLEAVVSHDGDSDLTIVYSDWDIYWEHTDGALQFRREVIVGDLSVDQLITWIVGNKPPGVPPFNTSSTLISRSIFDRHQFDESLGNLEETSFYYGVLNDNVSCVYVPMKGMYYRRNQGGNSLNRYSFVNGYIGFLETVYRINKNHLALNYRYWETLKQSVQFGDREMFGRLLRILYDSRIPVFMVSYDAAGVRNMRTVTFEMLQAIPERRPIDLKTWVVLAARVRLLRLWINGIFRCEAVQALMQRLKRSIGRRVRDTIAIRIASDGR